MVIGKVFVVVGVEMVLVISLIVTVVVNVELGTIATGFVVKEV